MQGEITNYMPEYDLNDSQRNKLQEIYERVRF
jgi:hypothetical protein